MNNLLIYCRPGFEKEAAAEITERASELQCYGFARVKDDSGYVLFELYEEGQADLLARKLPFRELIFARQMLVLTHDLSDLDPGDRIRPIVDACRGYAICGDLRVETADTNEAKELSGFCRKFTVPLRQALRSNEILTQKETRHRPVFHAFFLATDHVLLGYSYSFNNSEFHMGIPRLRFPSDAPSRSTLKLEEAFHVFVPKEEWDVRLTSGMKAVDLGACPGGWTYQLVRRGMMVTAVDNGMMADSLMETGQVKHLREDGFQWKPVKKNNYWLVCDMVDKPARVVHMVADWFQDGLCQEAIFNLKLPMKKRFVEAEHNLNVLRERLAEVDPSFVIQAKQLYHDREEITVHVYNRYALSKLVPQSQKR
ncbi:23S rRNA (cytidine(2498)-2'-O)-methyltransferase RlmM [Aeromonas simiae]|uniref:23S rRNA (cytidine(2498)-2'-O)-methyltransferase RlmM n=1 Tax=Aeromonas simiae TaxID=218936 RepID=UPI0005A8C8F2|nr:23S rRNA (cytidine(2498)-2'-O)-methyltransferase RlmM [Aeromonas simiae]MDO2947126.1 23S rRNA (cytidine(2498)-2'-O)-methyltransferase RlmM [Aeromonas simiae]MDO2950738.1 23S rRNA (cytidine(2498)-2'-O)-methyltransferase RlmM [Aeromonas simiae]MDO2954280.1 23S rRNA (cytidine(2498)-2'-O)-methyltransferase RlmM [Aeromonas simiae]